jgi:hypothetical protein
MNCKLIALGTWLTAGALCLPFWARAEEEVQSKDSNVMHDKLKNSQQLLEGIALADYTKITRSAEDLIRLTKREEWHVLNTPRYQTHTSDFQRAAERVIQKAKLKNIDGVTLAYFEMTMSCVRCHDYVRDVRDVSLPSSPTLDTR